MSHTSRRGKLTILCGAARSGKSTYAREWAQNPIANPFYDPDDNPRVVVDSDFIRSELTGQRYFRPAEPTVYSHFFMMIRALLASGHDVIADSTSTTKQSLRQLFEIDPDAEVVFISTPESVCIERAIATKQEDLIPVIKRMWQQIVDLANYGRTLEEKMVSGSWIQRPTLSEAQVEGFKRDVIKGIEIIREEVKNG